jgi:cation:H+ antiporter
VALLDLAQIAGGLIALYFGADWLVGAASTAARRLGVSPLLVGLTVVRSARLPGSSSGCAPRQPRQDRSAVVGANAINIGLILGTAALIRPLVVGCAC